MRRISAALLVAGFLVGCAGTTMAPNVTGARIKDVKTGLVWATKILTDPFHDIKLYHKAPLYLMRGELIDPRHADWSDEEAEEAPRAG